MKVTLTFIIFNYMYRFSQAPVFSMLIFRPSDYLLYIWLGPVSKIFFLNRTPYAMTIP